MKTWLTFGCGAMVLLAGCATPPAGTSGPAAQTDGPRLQVFDLAGIILVRPATSGPYEGDPPYFYLRLPNGTGAVHAHAEWSPPQDVGLEFHRPPPNNTERYTSWSSASPVQFFPPIDMTIPEPEAGDWFTGIGPTIVGGGVTWNMTLTVELTGPFDASIEPAGNLMVAQGSFAEASGLDVGMHVRVRADGLQGRGSTGT